MYIGNELGKIKPLKAIKRAAGKVGTAALQVAKPFLPGAAAAAVDVAVRAFEQKHGRPPTPQELEQIKASVPETTGISEYLPYIAIGGGALILLLILGRRRR